MLIDKMISFYITILTFLKLSYCDQYIEWCEEPDVRRRITSGDCHQFSFLYPTPRCICVKGIASLDIIGSRELIFGDGGCFSTSPYGRRISSLRLEMSIDPAKPLVAVQSTSTVQSFSWLFHEFTSEPKLIYTDAPYYVVNAEAVDLRQQFKGLPIICLQVHPTTEGRSWVRHYAMKTFPRYYLLLNQTCAGEMSMDETDLIESAPIANSGSQQCNPSCPSLEKPDESTLLDMRDHLARLHQLQSRKTFQRALEPTPVKTCESIEPQDKEKHKQLNKKLILEFIRDSFSQFSDGALESRAFQILEKFFLVTKRYCNAAKISSAFLPQALRSFKLVQRALSSSHEELFSREEFQTFFHLISRCQWDVSSLRMNTHGCSRQSNWVTSVYHPAGGEDHFDIPISDSYQKLSKYHLVVDVPYHVVDIALQACRRSFQRSPQLLTKLRAGMLKLFTSEAIHKFWMNPETLSNFNEHLFGPYWAESARSLLQCAEAAYAFNENSFRPARPNADKYLDTNSTGITTCAGARQLNALSEFHEISCTQGSIALQSVKSESKDYTNDDAYYEYSSVEQTSAKAPTKSVQNVTILSHESSTAFEQLLPLKIPTKKKLEISNETVAVLNDREIPIFPIYNTTELPDVPLNDIILNDYEIKSPQISLQPGRIIANLVPDYDKGEAIDRGSGRSVEQNSYYNWAPQYGRAAPNSNGGMAKSGAPTAQVDAPSGQTSGGFMIDFPEISESEGTGGQMETSSQVPPEGTEGNEVLDFPEEEDSSTVETITEAINDIIIIDWPSKQIENKPTETAPAGSGDVMIDFPYPDDVSTAVNNVTEGGAAGAGAEENGGDEEIPIIDFPDEENENFDVHISFPPEESSFDGVQIDLPEESSFDGVQIDLPEEDDNDTETSTDLPITEGQVGGTEGSEGGDFEGPGDEDIMLDLPDEDINVGGGGGTSDIYIDLPPNTNATTGEGSGPNVGVVPERPLLDFQDSVEGTDGNVSEPPRTDGGGIINGSSSTNNGSAGGVQWEPEGILLDFQYAINSSSSNSNVSAGVGTGGSTGERVDGDSRNTTGAAGAGNVVSTVRPRYSPGYFFYPKRRPARGAVKRF